MMQIREKQTEQLEEAASKGLKLGGIKKMRTSWPPSSSFPARRRPFQVTSVPSYGSWLKTSSIFTVSSLR